MTQKKKNNGKIIKKSNSKNIGTAVLLPDGKIIFLKLSIKRRGRWSGMR